MVYLVLSAFPKNLISRWVGRLARVRFPQALQHVLNKSFVAFFSIDMNESEFPASHYDSIEELFTRRLRPGLRSAAGTFVSPADGQVIRSQPLTKDSTLVVKDLAYSAEKLIGRTDKPNAWSWVTVVYLAPHNYHRVHVPFSAKVTAIRHICGTLWPVSPWFIRRIPQLYLQNERLVFDFELSSGGRAALVMVGAFNVGRMTTNLDPRICTNLSSEQNSGSFEFLPKSPCDVNVGDEIGKFMLGSTVVVLLDEEARAKLRPTELYSPQNCQWGQKL